MNEIIYLKPSLQNRQKRRNKRLGEELIECYRRGWRTKGQKGYKNKRKHNQYEHAGSKESMKFMHGGGSKTFNDNLERLKRFLNTHQGKYWNKLYSELCQKLDKRTLSGLHVFNHLWDFVYLHVTIKKGLVYYQRFGKEEELISSSHWPKFYIHPKTGQLKKVTKTYKTST